MTEFASLKKTHKKIIIVKRSFGSSSSGMSLICPDLYKLIFQTFYHASLILPKREIDEAVNFRNFRKFFTSKLSAFYGILAPHFQTGKMKEVSDKAHEACCNGCHL